MLGPLLESDRHIPISLGNNTKLINLQSPWTNIFNIWRKQKWTDECFHHLPSPPLSPIKACKVTIKVSCVNPGLRFCYSLFPEFWFSSCLFRLWCSEHKLFCFKYYNCLCESPWLSRSGQMTITNFPLFPTPTWTCYFHLGFCSFQQNHKNHQTPNVHSCL